MIKGSPYVQAMKALQASVIIAGLAALLAGCADADSAQRLAAPLEKAPYTPRAGQAGKDVIWLPTPQTLVDRMLDMAGLTPDDYLVDLGAGDGRTVIAAAKRGVRAHGLEFNARMVALALHNARKEGVSDRATFERADIFQTDFSRASVVTMFLLPELNLKLRPTLLAMKPGTRIVSNSFNMGDWRPDALVEAGADCKEWCYAYKWIVPARVEGRWRLGKGEVVLRQIFQFLDGEFIENGTRVRLADARLNGADIMFTLNGARFDGRVDGATITGRIDGGLEFVATRL